MVVVVLPVHARLVILLEVEQLSQVLHHTSIFLAWALLSFGLLALGLTGLLLLFNWSVWVSTWRVSWVWLVLLLCSSFPLLHGSFLLRKLRLLRLLLWAAILRLLLFTSILGLILALLLAAVLWLLLAWLLTSVLRLFLALLLSAILWLLLFPAILGLFLTLWSLVIGRSWWSLLLFLFWDLPWLEWSAISIEWLILSAVV